MREKVLFSPTDFLPWESLLIKKLDFEETNPTLVFNFKTDITKVGLVFSISNFFIKNISEKEICSRFSSSYLVFAFRCVFQGENEIQIEGSASTFKKTYVWKTSFRLILKFEVKPWIPEQELSDLIVKNGRL